MFKAYTLLVATAMAAKLESAAPSSVSTLSETQGYNTGCYGSCGGCGCQGYTKPTLKNVACAVYDHSDRLCDIEDKCEDLQDCLADLKADPPTGKCRIVATGLDDDGTGDDAYDDFEYIFDETDTLEDVRAKIEAEVGPLFADWVFNYWLEDLTAAGGSPYFLGSQLRNLKSLKSAFGLGQMDDIVLNFGAPS